MFSAVEAFIIKVILFIFQDTNPADLVGKKIVPSSGSFDSYKAGG